MSYSFLHAIVVVRKNYLLYIGLRNEKCFGVEIENLKFFFLPTKKKSEVIKYC